MVFWANLRVFLGEPSWFFWANLRGFLGEPSWFFGRTFVVFWANLRGFFGRTFVVFWANLRGFLVKPSWFFGSNLRVFLSNLRGFLGKTYYFYYITRKRCFLGTCPGNRYAHGAIQRPPKVFMDFQACSGFWFEGGVGTIRMILVVLVRWLV